MCHFPLVVCRTVSTVALGLLLVTAYVPPVEAQQQQMEDVVYLKNGSIIRGIIVEQRPGESILIQTRDGNVFRYAMSDIDRMTREPAVARPGAQGTRAVGRKDGGLAFLLSFLVTGLGQGYNGEWSKGAGQFLGQIALIAGASAAFDSEACWYDDNCGVAYAALVGVLAIKVWSLVDAPLSASRINRERAVGTSLELRPEIVRVGLGR